MTLTGLSGTVRKVRGKQVTAGTSRVSSFQMEDKTSSSRTAAHSHCRDMARPGVHTEGRHAGGKTTFVTSEVENHAKTNSTPVQCTVDNHDKDKTTPGAVRSIVDNHDRDKTTPGVVHYTVHGHIGKNARSSTLPDKVEYTSTECKVPSLENIVYKNRIDRTTVGPSHGIDKATPRHRNRINMSSTGRHVSFSNIMNSSCSNGSAKADPVHKDGIDTTMNSCSDSSHSSANRNSNNLMTKQQHLVKNDKIYLGRQDSPFERPKLRPAKSSTRTHLERVTKPSPEQRMILEFAESLYDPSQAHKGIGQDSGKLIPGSKVRTSAEAPYIAQTNLDRDSLEKHRPSSWKAPSLPGTSVVKRPSANITRYALSHPNATTSPPAGSYPVLADVKVSIASALDVSQRRNVTRRFDNFTASLVPVAAPAGLRTPSQHKQWLASCGRMGRTEQTTHVCPHIHDNARLPYRDDCREAFSKVRVPTAPRSSVVMRSMTGSHDDQSQGRYSWWWDNDGNIRPGGHQSRSRRLYSVAGWDPFKVKAVTSFLLQHQHLAHQTPISPARLLRESLTQQQKAEIEERKRKYLAQLARRKTSSSRGLELLHMGSPTTSPPPVLRDSPSPHPRASVTWRKSAASSRSGPLPLTRSATRPTSLASSKFDLSSVRLSVTRRPSSGRKSHEAKFALKRT